ncbi:MAG: hypothetical protein SYR96_00855 [Actinomycetota bacterium]|nr:hypothetical protein [Actinomycetota bacterium]
MTTVVNFRNALDGHTQPVEVQPGQTVQQAVEASGLIAAGNQFSVRDKDGQVVDNREATDFDGLTLSVGLPGDEVRGGSADRN